MAGCSQKKCEYTAPVVMINLTTTEVEQVRYSHAFLQPGRQ